MKQPHVYCDECGIRCKGKVEVVNEVHFLCKECNYSRKNPFQPASPPKDDYDRRIKSENDQ